MSTRAQAGTVPVIVISGHLGAGKTSLLNHLLREPGARLGVVINDFGAINVDAGLVTGQVDEAATISGGCLCCLPDSGGLDDALEQLSQPRLRMDAILVEASGAADPIALTRIIRFCDVPGVRHGGLIEVVDAVEHFSTVDVEEEPPSRYAAATLVVIGKTDLLPEGEREEVTARIRERMRMRNPRAQVVVADRGGIDPRLAFDASAEEDPVDELPIAELLREAAGAHEHRHAASAAVELPDAVAPGALAALLEDPPAGAYRMKGRVRVRGPRSEQAYVVHVVGSMVHVARLRQRPEPGELVAIGMDLDVGDAERRLRELADSAPAAPDPQGLLRLQRLEGLSG